MTDIETRLIALRDRSSTPRDREPLDKAILAVRALAYIKELDASSYACNICRYCRTDIDKPPCNVCGAGGASRFDFIGREVFE